MEIDKIEDLVLQIESLKKFAEKLNEIAGANEDIVIQLHKPLTEEQVDSLRKQGKAGGIMQIGTPDGKMHLEKPVARLKVPLEDIRPLLGDFCSHCLERTSKKFYELTVEVNE